MKDFVRNAADKKQVKDAERKEDRKRELQLNDLRKILSSVEGRRFIWRVLEHCRTFASVWEASARIHYLSGKQDVGHFLMSEVVEAKEDAFTEMMIESKKGVYDV